MRIPHTNRAFSHTREKVGGLLGKAKITFEDVFALSTVVLTRLGRGKSWKAKKCSPQYTYHTGYI
jgi:hypothetical protein